MNNNFFALISRMKYINRWALMRNTREENLSEHSLEVAVVAHGGVLDLVYRHVHGVPMERQRDFPLPNASINWLVILGDDWRLESWGDTAHLGDTAQAPFVTRI